MLGSDLVPDYLTRVEFGAFYGWPWNYWGGYEDKRVEPGRPGLREYTHRPDYGLGAHTADLDLTFAAGATLGEPFTTGAFIGLPGSWNRKPLAGSQVVFVKFNDNGHPERLHIDLLPDFLHHEVQERGLTLGETFTNGAFSGLHGSWNRKPLAGYKVLFVKFNEMGHPQGLPIDLLTGFLTKEDEARGRPVDVLIDNAGALLVSDDVGGVIWRVSNPKGAAAK